MDILCFVVCAGHQQPLAAHCFGFLLNVVKTAPGKEEVGRIICEMQVQTTICRLFTNKAMRRLCWANLDYLTNYCR